jgi:hypothetical protein
MIRRGAACAAMLAGYLRGQPGPLKLISVTTQQAIVEYTAPDANPCTLAVTDNSGFGVTVWDVNAGVFPNANQDLSRASTVAWNGGRSREVVIGKRTVEQGSDGSLYSRSLQANTSHMLGVTCTGGGASVGFQTLNIPVGNMAPDPPGFQAAGFGNAAWPTIKWANRNTAYIDPKTGLLLKPATWPGGMVMQNNGNLFNTYFDASGTWGTAANIVSGGASTLASSSTTNPIFVALNPSMPPGSSNWSGYSVTDLRINFTGNGNGTAQQIDFCLTADSGQTCISATQSVTLPASTGTVSFPASGFPAPPFSEWGMLTYPQHNLVMPVRASVNASGTAVTNLTAVPSASGLFPTNLPVGSKVLIAGSSCGNSLCTVASVGSSSTLTLNENVGTLSGAAFTMANFGLKILKHAAGGTVNVTVKYDVAFESMPNFLIQDGASDQCNRNPITLTQDAFGNTVSPFSANLCLLNFQDGTVVYAFVPATGEMRQIGMTYTTYGHGVADTTKPPLPQNPWDMSDPRTLYGLGFQSDTSLPELVRWIYRGHGKAYTTGALPYQGLFSTVPNGQSDGVTSCNGSEEQAGNMCVSLVTDPAAGHDFRAQVSALNPNYANGGFGTNPSPVSVVGNTLVSKWTLQQDAIAMFTYTNLATGVVQSAADTMWSTPNTRFGGLHTASGWVIANRYHLAAVNPLGSRGNSGAFSGPYKSTVSFVWRSSDGVTGTWDPNTALASNYSYPCPAAACGTVVPNAIQVRIAGMPCSASANANEIAHYPCPWSSAQGMLSALQVGDLLGDFAQPGGGVFSEELQILKITVNSPTDIALWLKRFGGAGPVNFANGFALSPFPSSSCTSGNWWYDSTSPTAAMLPDDCHLAGHIDIGAAPAGTFSFTETINAKYGVPASAVGIAAQPYNVGGFGIWAQKVANTNFPGNGNVEFYPSLRQWSAPDSEKVWAADWRAYQGGSFVNGGGGTREDNISFTPVTTGGRTHVWLVNQGYPVLPKILPMESWAGRYIFTDKSGPASNLSDADAWRYCIVYKAGECISGGSTTVGQVYMSSPVAITTAGGCFTNHMEAAIPCIVPASPIGTWAVQHDISVNDPYGRRYRRLTMAFNAPGRQYTATNWRPMPDASWGLTVTTFADGVFPVMFAAKLTPWPGYDAVRRDNFIPQPMKLGTGAALAEIRFGYEEFGTPGQFFCTSRQDACASGPSSAPFNYIAGDGHSGVACAAGCTITVPALPGRVLWWQEFRSTDGGTTWTAQGQLQPAAIP